MHAAHPKCPICSGAGTVAAVTSTDTRVVRGETYVVQSNFFACSQCHEMLRPQEGDVALRRAWDLYRQKHGMVMPQELTDWRNSLGLTQSELATILGWGLKTLLRYEDGKLQEPSHDQELRLAMQSAEHLHGRVAQAEALSEEARKRLVQRLTNRRVLSA